MAKSDKTSVNSVGTVGIRNGIEGFEDGKIFSPSTFYGYGGRALVDQALKRFADSKLIKQVGRGFYIKPKHSSIMGELSPTTDAIKDAIESKFICKMKHTGAFTANLLGLSEQVPAQLSFLTDGNSRTFQFGKKKVIVKHATPRRMAPTGKPSLIMEAFRYMGKEEVSDKHINRLRKVLSPEEKNDLISQMSYAPIWMHSLFKRIT